MVPMRMSDDRPADTLPGIDVEIAGRAIQSAIGRDYELFLCHGQP
jgi:hypothetical protein